MVKLPVTRVDPEESLAFWISMDEDAFFFGDAAALGETTTVDIAGVSGRTEKEASTCGSNKTSAKISYSSWSQSWFTVATADTDEDMMDEWVNDWWGWWSGYERECSLIVNAVRVGRVWYLLMNQQSNSLSSEVNCSNSKKILLLQCLSLSKVHDAVDSTLAFYMLSPVAVSCKRQPEMLFDSHGSSKREKGLVLLRCLWWLSRCQNII